MNTKDPEEELHVYSAGCAWSGPISAVGNTEPPVLKVQISPGKFKDLPSSGLPCCPHYGSMLFQTDEQAWWNGAQAHDRNGHTNYLKFMKWKEAQERCWPSLNDAAKAFVETTGEPVLLN